jgi:gluconolactonase
VIIDTVYEDRSHFLISTPGANYFYDKEGGGFSRMIDRDSHDWIKFKMDPWDKYPASAASSYRGMPNFVFRSPDSGAGHPGHDQCSSHLLGDHSIRTNSNSNTWQWAWTFYDDYTLVHIEKIDPDHNYWFLYEGPVNGAFDPDNQYWGTSEEGPFQTMPDYYTRSYTEGIVFDPDGHGYFSMEDSVYMFSPDRLEAWTFTPGANGHKILPDKSHLVCSMNQGAILLFDQNGKYLETWCSSSDGIPLRSPNDLCLDSSGGVYFTDPRGYNGNHELGTLHYVDTNRISRILSKGMAVPNGVVLDLKLGRLYVAETGKNRIMVANVIGPGIIQPFEIFVQLPEYQVPRLFPDGIALDQNGDLLVAHYGTGRIQVFNPKGQWISSYPSGHQIVSNLAFSPDNEHIYTTGCLKSRPGQGGIYQLSLPADH